MVVIKHEFREAGTEESSHTNVFHKLLFVLVLKYNQLIVVININ